MFLRCLPLQWLSTELDVSFVLAQELITNGRRYVIPSENDLCFELDRNLLSQGLHEIHRFRTLPPLKTLNSISFSPGVQPAIFCFWVERPQSP